MDNVVFAFAEAIYHALSQAILAMVGYGRAAGFSLSQKRSAIFKRLRSRAAVRAPSDAIRLPNINTDDGSHQKIRLEVRREASYLVIVTVNHVSLSPRSQCRSTR